jgi:chemotaxis protein MotB
MKRHKHPEHINHERWLVSYADFITLLFAFFVVMFAVSRVDTQKLGRFSQSFSEAMGLIDEGAQGLMPGTGDRMAEPTPGVNATGPGDEIVRVREELEQKQKEAPGEARARIKVVQRRNELVLRLDDNILFDSGDDRVRETAQKALRAVAALVKDRPVELRVEGHTDNVPVRNGRFRSNWELSTARATAVIAELAQTGFAPERLSAAGYGEFHPVGPNDSPENRAHNRRVDLVISGISLPGAPGPLASAATGSAPPLLPRPPAPVAQPPGSPEPSPSSVMPSPAFIEPSPKVIGASPSGQTAPKEGHGHADTGHGSKGEGVSADHAPPKVDHAPGAPH